MAPRNVRLAAGGLLALLVLPLAVLAFRAPIWLGLMAALAILAVSLGGRPRANAADPPLGANPVQGLEAALGEALPALQRLKRLAPQIQQSQVRGLLQQIAALGQGVLETLEHEPRKLWLVQRLLMHYLPRTADIAQSYAELERRGVLQPARIAAVQALLQRLAGAAELYARRLVDEQMRELDSEVALLEAALQDDLGQPAPGQGETQ